MSIILGHEPSHIPGNLYLVVCMIIILQLEKNPVLIEMDNKFNVSRKAVY